MASGLHPSLAYRFAPDLRGVWPLAFGPRAMIEPQPSTALPFAVVSPLTAGNSGKAHASSPAGSKEKSVQIIRRCLSRT
eukprot:16431879-Heterocapsa_arctica.AAC.1